MKNYLHWALRQFYLLCFWPTRYEHENQPLNEKSISVNTPRRIMYISRLLPVLVLIVAAGHLICGLLFEHFTGRFEWFLGTLGLVRIGAWGVVLCIALGIRLGIAFILAFSVPMDVFCGFIGRGELLAGSFEYLFDDVTFGITCGIAGGLGLSLITMVSGFPSMMVSGLPLLVSMGLVIRQTVRIAFGHNLEAIEIAAAFALPLAYFRLISFPFDACWGWLCWHRVKRNSALAPFWWRKHPLSWNQVIWLPLPLATDFLAALVKYDRAFGFNKIAFVVAERPLQRYAAQQALVDVALDDFEAANVEQLTAVANRVNWLIDWQTHLLPDLIQSAGTFVRISEFVTQSTTMQNRFNQLGVIARADLELDNLRKRLIAQPGPVARRLLRRANEWNVLLAAERQRLSALAREEGEIPQVFRFGNPVRADEAYVFAGRTNIVRELESVFIGDAHPPAVLLYGPRRIGKSSILLQLPRLLGPEFASCTLDCQSPAVRESASRFFRSVSDVLSEALARRGICTKPLLLESLGAEPFGVFDDWLQHVEHAMTGSLRAFICFDEYEALHETLRAGWGERLLDYLRHLQQHRPRFVLVFTGTRTFHTLGREWTSRFVSARSTRVSFLTAEEFRPMLERPIPEFNLRYTADALEALLRLTRGQPYLTQAVARELVDLMNDDRRHDATPDDVERAAQEAMRSGEEYFHNVWDDAEAEGQALLCALAQGQPVPLGSSRSHLREMDVLDDKGRFAVPLFEKWVKQKRGAEARR